VLKIDINKDKDQSIIQCEGAGDELLAELAMVVHDIYSGIHNNDPMMASAFKHLFISLVSVPGSPVWQCKSKMADGSYCIVMPAPGKDDGNA
jgi:hypothetical protein